MSPLRSTRTKDLQPGLRGRFLFAQLFFQPTIAIQNRSVAEGKGRVPSDLS